MGLQKERLQTTRFFLQLLDSFCGILKKTTRFSNELLDSSCGTFCLCLLLLYRLHRPLHLWPRRDAQSFNDGGANQSGQVNQSVVHRLVEWRSCAVFHLSREYQEKIGEHLPSLRCHSTIQRPPKRGAIPGLKSVRPCTCLEACCSTWPLWVAVWINANSDLVNEPEEVTAVAQVFCYCRLRLCFALCCCCSMLSTCCCCC